MTIHFASPDQIEDWDAHILSNPDHGNVFQSYEFAQQKRLGSWTPRFIMAGNTAITVLEKRSFGFSKLWYLPKGPGVSTIRQLDDLLPALRNFAQKNGVFAIKIEPELLKKEETLADLMKLSLKRVRPIQPNFSTVTLDISPDLDTVMARLNQKGRHAIHRAKRDGVITKRVEATDENCDIMYNLLAETAADSFNIRDKEYYIRFWKRYAEANLGQLFFAYFENKPVAGAFALIFGKKSTYKDGASVRERTAYGASHLLQWEVITWAKERGAIIHDLCGAPPSDQINNPDHPHYGIGRFKTSFNKEVTDYIGAYDVVINPTLYSLWEKLGERVALRLHYTLHHDSYY